MIDSSALTRLRKMVPDKDKGDALVRQLIGLFSTDTPEVLAQMKRLCQEQLWNELALQAHSLKSSAANLGAMEMASICERIERRGVMPSELPELVNLLQREFAIALNELKLQE